MSILDKLTGSSSGGYHDGFLQTIDEVRTIEWNTDHLWDIKLPTIPQNKTWLLPKYFKNWVPIIDVDEGLASLDHKVFEFYNTQVFIPESTSEKEIQVMFIDDVHNNFMNWNAKWINEDILGLNNKGRVKPVLDSARQIWIRKLTRQKKEVETRKYWIVPEGKLSFAGKTQADLSQYMITYKIVGKA